LEHLLAACGDDGVFPVEKKLEATKFGREEVVISPAVILFVSPFLLPSSFFLLPFSFFLPPSLLPLCVSSAGKITRILQPLM
jgi:hypothetical protein